MFLTRNYRKRHNLDHFQELVVIIAAQNGTSDRPRNGFGVLFRMQPMYAKKSGLLASLEEPAKAAWVIAVHHSDTSANIINASARSDIMIVLGVDGKKAVSLITMVPSKRF